MTAQEVVDGIPDAWEISHGLNPKDAKDGSQFNRRYRDYTNLEVYMNSLVEHVTSHQNRMPVLSRDLFWLNVLKMVNFLKKS